MQHGLMLFTFLFQFTGHGDVRHKKIKMDKQGWGRRQPSTPNRQTADILGIASVIKIHAYHSPLRVIAALNLSLRT